jgi:Domain of unknown function (DUF4350)
MPANLERKIDPSDRKLLLATAVVLIILTAAMAFVSPPPSEQSSPIPSIFSTSPDGARAAFVLLQELGRNVQVWEQPPTELPEDAEDAVLILANPIAIAGEGEKKALLAFVKKGGRILFTGPRIAQIFPDARLSDSDESVANEWKTFEPIFPSNYTRGAARISLKPEATWDESQSQLALYGNPQFPVIASWRLGEGEILWWAGPGPLTNSGITREGNLNLFLNAVRDARAGRREQPDIYWDEYYHGEEASLWGYFQKTPVLWGLLQVSILGLVVLFTFSRRSGPTAVPPVASRRSPLEFVDTLGGLYERAHAEPAVVAAVYQRFRAILTRQLRLPLATPDAALEEAATKRLGVKDDELLKTLRRAESASRSQRLPPADALEIVQQLESYERRVGLKRKFQQENP